MTATDRTQVALPVGHQVHWYEIRAVVGQGGFGITYLARDTNLDHLVAIKEYLPPNLAVRSGESAVHPVSEGRASIFDWGLERFLREARTLVKFKHPNIVTVFSVFEANGTAYMVMEYERGVNLEQAIDAGLELGEAELLGIVHPLLDGLELVHGGGFIHRDIKPENILLRKDGSPVLLDFGSARESLIGESPTLTTLVTPGYAPFEQYQDERHSSKQQGPWSDIYALSATLYRVINGEGPVDALTRVNSRLDKTPDPLRPASEIGANRFSAQFLQAIDAALQFDVQDRPQDVAQWRRMFPEGGSLPDMHGISDANLAWAEWESRKAGQATGALTGLRSGSGETQRIDQRRVPRFVWVGVLAGVVVGGIVLGNILLGRAVPEQSPIAKIVAAPPASARDDEIGELLRAAAADVEALRLTTPAGENAFERYQQVLALEPGNEDAARGLEVIVIRYVTLANTALSKGEHAKAEQYLDAAAGVLPDDDGIALARNMLAAAAASQPAAASGSAAAAPAAAAPRRVALLPFWGRQSAAAAEDGPDVSVEISEFAHNFLRGRSSLDMIYSYYQPGFDHAAVNGVKNLWSGDAVKKVPELEAIREIGRELGADGVLVYGYEPKPGAGAEVQAYLVDVGDGRVIRREGVLADLAEITRTAFEDWTTAGD